MKTSRRWVQPLSLAAAGFLILLPSIQAGPGVGTMTGTVGAVSTGGGHAVSSASVGVTRSAGPSPGIRSSVGPVTATHFAPVAPTYHAPAIRPANTFGPRLGVSPVGANTARPAFPRSINSWTDPANPRTILTGKFSRNDLNGTAPRRSDPVYGLRPGNHLYAGAYRDGSNRFSDGRSPRGPNNGYGYRGHHRYYVNNFPYGVYYPYLYNNYGYYGGYASYGSGDGFADYSSPSADTSIADLGAPDFSNNPNNYYSYVAPEPAAPETDASAPSTQPLPDAPAVGPQDPSSPDKSTGATQGPDSLVEAVQNELSRRGYFAGKPDSMYSPATKEAIRRFQTDQGLPATGRINEATLHSLHLD